MVVKWPKIRLRQFKDYLLMKFVILPQVTFFGKILKIRKDRSGPFDISAPQSCPRDQCGYPSFRKSFLKCGDAELEVVLQGES